MEGKNEGEGGGKGEKGKVTRVRDQKLTMKGKGEFPGGPVVKMLLLPMYGAWVQSLVRELRSYIPHGKKKKRQELGRERRGRKNRRKTGRERYQITNYSPVFYFGLKSQWLQ